MADDPTTTVRDAELAARRDRPETEPPWDLDGDALAEWYRRRT